MVLKAEDVVIGLSIAGVVKVWTLTGHEIRSTEPIYEDESKPIRCLNAIRMTCCIYNQRTVLVVCTKYWQVLDVWSSFLITYSPFNYSSRSTTRETSLSYVLSIVEGVSVGLEGTS